MKRESGHPTRCPKKPYTILRPPLFGPAPHHPQLDVVFNPNDDAEVPELGESAESSKEEDAAVLVSRGI